jgi:ribonuclease D
VWKEKYPLRYAALTNAKHTLLLRAQELEVPLENLISPEFVRRICWSNPRGGVEGALLELGARNWQVEIATPLLEAALLQETPLVIEEEAPSPASEASSEE